MSRGNKKKHHPQGVNSVPVSGPVPFGQHHSLQYQGPLPPPAMLEKYDQLVNGAADRIIRLAEDQAHHRMYLEKKVVNYNLLNSRIGMFLAFIIAMSAIFIGAWLIYHDKDSYGISAIIGSLVSLVSVFVIGRYFERKERNEKLQIGIK